MTLATADRTQVITMELENKLKDYMALRHFFRHAYPMNLRWDLLSPLHRRLEEVHRMLRGEINGFIEKLDEENSAASAGDA